MIWYDNTVWLYHITEYATVTYYLWFGMTAQYERPEALWISCIAEYTATTDYLYV